MNKNALLFLMMMPFWANGQKAILYVGTFSERESKGIYVYEFDLQSAETKLLHTIDHLKSPSFLTLHPNGQFLYAANRESIVEGKDWASLTAFAIDPTNGNLRPLNDASALAPGACYIQADHTGQQIFVANYAGGSMAAYALEEDGKIGPILGHFPYQKENGPEAHAHAAVPSPDNRFIFVPDLGNDEVVAYKIRPKKGKIKMAKSASFQVEKGFGPRHLIFHPNGRFAFIAEELKSSVTAYAYQARTGQMDLLQRESTLPSDFKEFSKVADIQIHPNGKFLYVSNRGHNSLALFAVDPTTGGLTKLGHQATMGEYPRGFMITQDGRYLLVANRNSDNIVIFEIDADNGSLKETGQEIQMPSPVCLKMKY